MLWALRIRQAALIAIAIALAVASTYLLTAALISAARAPTIVFALNFTKLPSPVLRPSGSGPDAAATYNPAVVYVNGTFYMLYRAQARWRGVSVIMLAVSRDGIHFRKLGKVVLYPSLREEMGGGCEDPRIVEVNGTYYMTYTAYNGRVARLALAVSKDLVHWKKLGIVFPGWGWSKSGAILPIKIHGRYVMYFGDSNIWIAYSKDMVHWVTNRSWVVLRPRPGHFDSKLVEPGPPPILTKEGILLIYNAADREGRYYVGWALFSRDDPTKLIARAEKPILSPTYPWEIRGQTPNVVFATALVRVNDTWYLYYGAADTYVGVAIARGKHIIEELSPSVTPLHLAIPTAIGIAIAMLATSIALASLTARQPRNR